MQNFNQLTCYFLQNAYQQAITQFLRRRKVDSGTEGMNTHPTSAFRTASPEAEPLLWSTADLANYMRCSERHVLALRHKGLPSIKLGHLIRFEPQAVRQWLAAVTESKPRSQQLADIAATGSEDNAECAAADLAREFPDTSH
jgi:excisionase family DNA binding protein